MPTPEDQIRALQNPSRQSSKRSARYTAAQELAMAMGAAKTPAEIIRLVRLVQGANPDPLAASSGATQWHSNLMHGQYATKNGPGQYPEGQWGRVVDSGLLDAVTSELGGKQLTPQQLKILEIRYRNAGTPMHQATEDLYEQSPNRWDGYRRDK
jgi:hypothetical protein